MGNFSYLRELQSLTPAQLLNKWNWMMALALTPEKFERDYKLLTKKLTEQEMKQVVLALLNDIYTNGMERSKLPHVGNSTMQHFFETTLRDMYACMRQYKGGYCISMLQQWGLKPGSVRHKAALHMFGLMTRQMIIKLDMQQ